MLIIDAIQGTDEWLQARAGVLTASRFSEACDVLKSGKPSQASIDLAYLLAEEIVSKEPSEGGFATHAMRRGSELEPEARAMYEGKTGAFVDECGLILSDDRRYGYSPDGLIGDDGLIEIKCPSNARKKAEIWRGDVSEYIHQMQGGLWITGRKWCDFIMYDPAKESVGKSLYIKRIERDEAFIADMTDKLAAFLKTVDEHVAFWETATA